MSADVEPPKSTGRGLVRGGVGIGAATTLASAANYASNVVLGRGLGPDEFADAALVVSALLMLGAVALGFQLTAARAVAAGNGAQAAVVRRNSIKIGVVVGASICAAAPLLSSVVNMASAVPFVVLGLGVPIYLPMAVARGVAQARHDFARLGASLAIEALARLAVTIGAVAAGLGATGAALALVVSFVAASLPCRGLRPGDGPAAAQTRSGAVVGATVLLLAGQVAISNGDLWIVSAMLPEEAGVYAAVALIGRLVFITAWSVVTVVFPSLVAGDRNDDGPERTQLLWRALAITAGFGLALTAGARAFGDVVIVSMVGDGYGEGATLLWPYALATTLFVLSNLCAVADIAAGRLTLPAVTAAGAVVQTATLALGATAGIAWVVWAQVGVMAGLVAASTGVVSLRSVRVQRPTVEVPLRLQRA